MDSKREGEREIEVEREREGAREGGEGLEEDRGRQS